MRVTKLRKFAVVMAASSLLLAGCSSSSDEADSGAYAGPVKDTPGTINVLAWPGYAEDGSTDPNVDWVTPFEEATGCTVNVKTYGTSDEAVQLMQSGGLRCYIRFWRCIIASYLRWRSTTCKSRSNSKLCRYL